MRQRTVTALLTVLVLMLSVTPVAAEDERSSGTATTDLLGITLEVDGVEIPIGDIAFPGIALDALEISTLADTTDGTVALVDALPLAVNGSELGRTTLRSEDGQDRSDSTSAIPLGSALGEIGPLDLRATTTEDAATALVGATEDLAADLAILGESGVSLSGLLSRSHVDPDGAAGTVGLEVSGIGLGVGDLLGDLLADLPLDTLLGLAGELLDGADGLPTGELADAVAAATEAVGDLADSVGDLEDLLDAGIDAGNIAALADLLDAIEEGLEQLTEALEVVLEEIEALVAAAVELIGDLVADLDGASLLDIGAIGVAMDAGADADSATATMDCVLGGTAVECVEHATAVTGLVSDALGTLTAVADVLGVTADDIVLEIFGTSDTATSTEGATNTAAASLEVLRLGIPAITLDVGDVDLGLGVDTLLDTVAAVLGDLEEALGDLEDAVDDLDGGLLGDLIGELDLPDADALDDLIEDLLDAVTELLGEDAVSGLLDDIEAELGDLLDLLLGDVDGLSTPSAALVVDPTVTASFTPTADDVDLGAPDPDDDPPLPTTGGGLVLLALLAIAAAAALLRRRPDGAT